MAALSFLSSVAARPVAAVSTRKSAANTSVKALGGGGPNIPVDEYKKKMAAKQKIIDDNRKKAGVAKPAAKPVKAVAKPAAKPAAKPGTVSSKPGTVSSKPGTVSSKPGTVSSKPTTMSSKPPPVKAKTPPAPKKGLFSFLGGKK
eukprot:CAMPEP_0197614916 /NCGR_PEP_ID=MMETSP1326-20131121/59768_1 /TAXON_ID=1155430 /ORGANISM="Genus nov. species nov., Strain RCC2288" /LENGTH=144 /DNA_ID=CAMNT_0043183795 /DNA_START=101 /DNA_END=535 /DNA_ORIENTATION=-